MKSEFFENEFIAKKIHKYHRVHTSRVGCLVVRDELLQNLYFLCKTCVRSLGIFETLIGAS